MAKISLREKLRKDIGLRSSNFHSEMVKNHRAKKSFFGLWHSLLVDLGHNAKKKLIVATTKKILKKRIYLLRYQNQAVSRSRRRFCFRVFISG